MSTATVVPTPAIPPPVAPEPVMELTVHRDALLAELSVAHGISSTGKTTVPILTNLLLEARNGRLTISCTNLEESICTSLPAQIQQEGAATVPARKFFDYVRLLPQADLSLKLLPNSWVQIISGRSRTKMLGIDRSNYPQIPTAGELPKVKMPSEILRAFIPRITIAISSDESRYTLNGALLVLEPQLVTMVATDGHRLAKIERSIALDGVDAERKVIVPARALAALQTLLSATKEESIDFAEDGSTLYFRVGERHLSSRKLSGLSRATRASYRPRMQTG